MFLTPLVLLLSGAGAAVADPPSPPPPPPATATATDDESAPAPAATDDDMLTPYPYLATRIEGGPLAERQRVNRDATLWWSWKQCDDTGRIANFRRAAGTETGPYQGYLFNDSDVYKVVEGASYLLGLRPDPVAEMKLDAVIDQIVAAQQEDGYLDTYYTLAEPDKKWSNIDHGHEMYCMGHLIEAAVARYEASGDRRLLKVADSIATLLNRKFGPAGTPAVPGHPELEIALMRLYEVTGNPMHLALAERMIDQRGVHDQRPAMGEYCQDHLPLREQTEVVGHAVRAMYLFNGATRLAIEKRRQGRPDAALEQALKTLWTDLTTRKMYVTGGIGSSSHNEGFTAAFDLPNDDAYAETCAAIGLVMWAHQMNLLTGDASYFDVLERTLYNAVFSGVALDGKGFFYTNPLASRSGAERVPWYGCACCPPNVLRLIASLGGLVFARTEQTLFVNLYTSASIDFSYKRYVAAVAMRTDYPDQGTVELVVDAYRPFEFTLALRIPGWSTQHSITVNDKPFEAPVVDGYARVHRIWQLHDQVRLDFAMPVQAVQAPPEVESCAGRFALQRGPVVYCVEGLDSAGDLRQLFVPRNQTFATERRDDLLGGVTVVEGTAERTIADGSTEAVPFAAIPYATWANRSPSPMLVWLPEDAAHADRP
ncbi:MAG: glycoside hydrolase family 127 protein, partial [Phycisphaerales bacterium]|nr:glycoside hydrolase family 127 protein [Phycisphaerales bacterium]